MQDVNSGKSPIVISKSANGMKCMAVVPWFFEKSGRHSPVTLHLERVGSRWVSASSSIAAGVEITGIKA